MSSCSTTSDPNFRLSQSDLEALAERGSFPAERLSAPFNLPPTLDDARIENRVTRWRNLASKGNDAVFRRILLWRGIDFERLRPALGGARIVPNGSLPPWVERFQIVLERAG